MIRIRRTHAEPRLEIMPLIDVIFLLLTFFIYAMVLMHPIAMLDFTPPALGAGAPPSPAPKIAISIDREGVLYVDRIETALAEIRSAVDAKVAADPRAEVWVIADRDGDADRLPVFFALMDELADAGFAVKLGGAPGGR